MKKINSEALQKILDTISLEQNKRYYMRFTLINFYLKISDKHINGSSDLKITINELPTGLYYWEVLYILNIIIKHGGRDYLDIVEIGEI